MAAFEESVEEMVGMTREAASGDRVWRGRDGDDTGGPGDVTGDKTAAMKWRVAIESGGDETAMRPAVPGTRPAVTADDEAAGGDRVRRGRDGDETRDETGGLRDETGDKTAATASDEHTAVIGGVMYTNEWELEFNEDEMAALEGQRLVAEFRCGI